MAATENALRIIGEQLRTLEDAADTAKSFELLGMRYAIAGALDGDVDSAETTLRALVTTGKAREAARRGFMAGLKLADGLLEIR